MNPPNRFSNHTDPGFYEFCAGLNESYCRALESAVQRVVSKLGMEEARRRLKLHKLPDDDDCIIATRLEVDQRPVCVVFARTEGSPPKIVNRIDWTRDAVEMGFME